jgi:drug/metabolite transporter (DMT)-like permease
LTSLIANFRGELAAIAAALIWAFASVIYTGIGRQLSPLVLNLVKGLIALGLLILTLLLVGELTPSVSPTATGLLLLSGAIGIGFGDTAYFQALNCIGARRALVLESLAPPLAAILASLFLDEQLATRGWWGIGLTIVGVVWVVIERSTEPAEAALKPAQGIGFGLLAALGQAGGAVLSRAALAGSTIDPLWSTFIRLAAGVTVLLCWLLLRQSSGKAAPISRELAPLRSRRLFLTLCGTAFASTYLAIWLQQTSLKYAPAGIAQALSATSPVFVIPIAMARGEKVSLRAVLGVLLAMAGIWLLFDRR